jgi:hypothetical protein
MGGVETAGWLGVRAETLWVPVWRLGAVRNVTNRAAPFDFGHFMTVEVHFSPHGAGSR